ncbi:MAG TPA: recombinase family protein, partial [Terriglobales bacterium]
TSGLGLEAQCSAVTAYLDGGRWKLIAEFTEVESGKKNGRPELAKALVHYRIYNATLIIAKLDRLARNVGFINRRRFPDSESTHDSHLGRSGRTRSEDDF